jgi:hypothetical protein
VRRGAFIPVAVAVSSASPLGASRGLEAVREPPHPNLSRSKELSPLWYRTIGGTVLSGVTPAFARIGTHPGHVPGGYGGHGLQRATRLSAQRADSEAKKPGRGTRGWRSSIAARASLRTPREATQLG